MILPEEEQARIQKILQRAKDKAEGKLDLSDMQLTEDNPDGLDISLYKGEDQLDKIEKKRSKSSSTGKSKNDKDEAGDEKTKSEESIANDKSNPDTKKGRGRPKENKPEPTSKPAKEDTGGKREKRKASKNMSYEAYDFLEEEDDEVMPAPKKRKSQDSITEPVEAKVEDKKAGKAEKTDSKASDGAPKKDAEPLSTSERALLADKEKEKDDAAPVSADAAAAAGTDLPDEEAEDDSQQPVKKRGRKPKAKEWMIPGYNEDNYRLLVTTCRQTGVFILAAVLTLAPLWSDCLNKSTVYCLL